MSDYDAWKLATPWDNEYELTVDFECSNCEVENVDVSAVAGRGDSDVYVECEDCSFGNDVSLEE